MYLYLNFIYVYNRLLNRFYYIYIYFRYFITNRGHLLVFFNMFFRYLLKFIKIKFFGKGYRVFMSNRKSLTFNFGYSHYYLNYFFQILPLITAKTKLCFYGLNFFVLRSRLRSFLTVRDINIFTQKGCRFFKQIIKKKIGKLSTYF